MLGNYENVIENHWETIEGNSIDQVTSTNRVLQILHMNPFGPITHVSINGRLCTLVVVDDYSRYT